MCDQDITEIGNSCVTHDTYLEGEPVMWSVMCDWGMTEGQIIRSKGHSQYMHGQKLCLGSCY